MWAVLTKESAHSDCGSSFETIQLWHPAFLHICQNLIQNASLAPGQDCCVDKDDRKKGAKEANVKEERD